MLFLGSPKKMIHDEAGGCPEQLEELSKRQMEADLGRQQKLMWSGSMYNEQYSSGGTKKQLKRKKQEKAFG